MQRAENCKRDFLSCYSRVGMKFTLDYGKMLFLDSEVLAAQDKDIVLPAIEVTEKLNVAF